MIRNLQALRFVFSFSILVSHLLGHEYSTFGLGEYGVVGFFVLSGFVLSVAYGRKIEKGEFNTWPFFLKQWAKLYPLHIATFLLAIFYEHYYGNDYTWFQLIPPVFLVQSWIPDEQFHLIPNGSSWSLCGFFFFYLVFSFFYVLCHRLSFQRLLTMVAVVLLVYVAMVISMPEQWIYPVVYTSPLMRLPDFIIGIVLHRLLCSKTGEWVKQKLERCNQFVLTLIEMSVLLSPILAFLIYGEMNAALRCVSLFWFFVGIQLLLFSWGDSCKGLVTQILHSRMIMFLGSISFEIYLLHMFVVPSARSMAFRLGFSPVGIVAMVIAVAVTVPLAWVTKKYFVDSIFNWLKPYILK